jgi:16S rRNA G527 N7-methylase RsmG
MVDKILAPGAATLIAGVDIAPSRAPRSLSQLHHLVQNANKTLNNILKITILALREPQNSRQYMSRLRSFLCEIVEKRMSGLKQYQHQLGNEVELANLLL